MEAWLTTAYGTRRLARQPGVAFGPMPDVPAPVLEEARTISPRLTVRASPCSAPAWIWTTGSMIQGTLCPETCPAFAECFERLIEA